MDERDDLVGHVFISYVRENAAAVKQLQLALESAGVRVWRDTADLWPGDVWREEIRNAIVSNSLVFIACFSRESIAREVSYQNEELVVAIEQLRLRRLYQVTLSALDWDNFYDNLHGAQFFDDLRLFMKHNYDYVLIDSRTGLTDIADICTVHLPDVVVDCFTLSTRAIEGASMIATMIQAHQSRAIRVLPVPMRIDHAEIAKVDARLAFAVRKFKDLWAEMPERQRRDYLTAVEIPYRAFYAYEEMLAVFGDPPGFAASLLSSFERLTAQITNGAVTSLPPLDEKVRQQTKLLFTESGDQDQL